VEHWGEASLGQVHQVLYQVQVPQKRFIVNKVVNVETHPKLSILKIGKNLMFFPFKNFRSQDQKSCSFFYF
jgi:hypothetical protein